MHVLFPIDALGEGEDSFRGLRCVVEISTYTGTEYI